MEKNTKNYNTVQNKLENVLKCLDCKFEKIDFEDDDINYIVKFYPTKDVKFINYFQGLIFASVNENSITLLINNVYSIDKSEKINSYYKFINDLNNFIIHGRFSIKKDIRRIIYSASIDCGENFEELSDKKIKILFNDFLENLITFIYLFKKSSNKNYGE